MKYLLDTNICIYIIKQKPISVKQRFQSFDISDMGISIVTLGELEYGAAKSQNPSRNRQTLGIFCAPFEIVGLNPEDARVFGNIRADLEKRGQPIISTLPSAMNEQPQLAYLSLIRELLNCPSGEKNQILNQHLDSFTNI